MDIASRLTLFRDYLGLTNSELCEKTRIPRPTLSQFLSGRNKRLSDNLAARIHEGYPNLNMMWLLFGEGDMLVNPNIEISEGKFDQKSAGSEKQNLSNQQVRQHEQRSLFDSDSEPNQKKDNEDDHLEVFRRESRMEITVHEQPETTSPTVKANPSKLVNHIMVFYTDGSYDEFRPVKRL